MPYDLSRFGLGDMLRCSLEVRRVAKGAPTMEQAADRVVRHLYDASIDPTTGERSCVLVRCYKTHPYRALEPALRRAADSMLRGGGVSATPEMRCLTLLASAGAETAWNSRQGSRGHRAIPLPSADMVQQAPMIAQLITQFGVEVAAVVNPSPDVLRELAGKTYNIFHVENALDSPYIPAQRDFVVPYGVRSVLGFGGSLTTGDLYAVILFARVAIPRDSADRFRTIALDVKSAFFAFREDEVFAPELQGVAEER